MNETLVERMGHAIGNAAIEAASNSEETPWETIALAALRAIREPTPSMIAAAWARINADKVAAGTNW
jgi:histidinol-phosphate/aromatic aminotransferase/cobyric acid decarboxylase-like protein